ncbi:hypothetical protein SDC9_147101 [bioreactor metagenome]|uniref:Uncharacterized protein n=1 Tax=bioreactor metagenome TaxID=1076179 RepID=A0A645EDT6_9ZZZZ
MQPFGDGRNGLLHRHSGDEARIDHDALFAVGVSFLRDISARHNLDDGQIKGLGKFVVPFVMRGHAHDGAGTVSHKHIVRYKNRDFLTGDRVDSRNALKAHAGLLLGKLGALHIRLAGCLRLIGFDRIEIGKLLRPFFKDGMLRGNDHKGSAKQRVRPC